MCIMNLTKLKKAIHIPSAIVFTSVNCLLQLSTYTDDKMQKQIFLASSQVLFLMSYLLISFKKIKTNEEPVAQNIDIDMQPIPQTYIYNQSVPSQTPINYDLNNIQLPDFNINRRVVPDFESDQQINNAIIKNSSRPKLTV